MVVAVAEDSRGQEHVRPWIEQAKAEYWCLIDPDHRVASLYGMANVPRAVWIDERGRIARPPETAGSTDHFRNMDPKTLTMSPADQSARDAGKAFYVSAIKEWVATGRHALDASAAQEKLPRITDDSALPPRRMAAPARRRGGGEPPSGRRQSAASRILEHVAPVGGSRGGRQGRRAGVLGTRASAGSQALPPASRPTRLPERAARRVTRALPSSFNLDVARDDRMPRRGRSRKDLRPSLRHHIKS